MPITSPEEAFAYELASIYDAELRFAEAQHEVVLRVTDERLRSLVEAHIAETEQQVKQLQQVFEILGRAPEQIMSATSGALLSDGWKVLQEAADSPPISDHLMALALAKIEHFEISCYRGLMFGAEALSQPDVLRLIQENLEQEERTAQALEEHARVLGQQAFQAPAS